MKVEQGIRHSSPDGHTASDWLSTDLPSITVMDHSLSALELAPSAPPMQARESVPRFAARVTRELLNVKFALLAFVINTLRRRYHNSVLGFAWSLLNPLLTMSVIAMVFSLIFHRDPKQFAVYLFAGMLPWSFITESLVGGSTAMINFESYLKKIYLPKAFFPLVVVSIAACNFFFSLVSLILLGLACGMHPTMSLSLVPCATIVLFMFNCALALILSVATLYLRDLTHIVSVLLSMLFYTMPIIYPIEQMPTEYHGLFLWDPFYYFLKLFKVLLYEGTIPALSEWYVPLGITAVSLVVAFGVLKWKERDIIYRL